MFKWQAKISGASLSIGSGLSMLESLKLSDQELRQFIE